MTAATATPQLMRDRLLQAIDGQSNICNMVAVMEVISYLEKYPITKEALEETRLGKLINDVRKKTKNEDLAKRAKKLLRNWQKLIEPGQNEALPKGHTGNTGSSSGGVHVGKADLSTSAPTPPSARAAPELKNRNDFNNSPKIEKSSGRKRKCEQKEGQHLQAKMAKTFAFDKSHKALLPSNGIGGGSGALTDVSYSSVHQPSDKEAAHQPDADRLNKIPVNTVRPHPSSLGFNRAPSTSALLKTSVLQQHARLDQMASGGQCQPRSPRCSSHSPRTPKQEGGAKQTAAKTAAASSPGGVPLSMEGSGLGPSPLPSPQPLNACVQGSHTDGLWSADAASKPANSRHSLSASVIKDEGGLEVDGTVDNTERKKKKKYRPKDYVVNLDGQAVDDGTKPVRLKDRRLTFDHATGQIKSCLSKESCPEDEVVRPASAPDTTTTEVQKQNPPVLPSPFQQTNWKELSRNDIIQSYLSQQSSVLTTSGARAPGALFFMNEYLKKEELHIKEASRKMHVLASDHVAATDLPGVTREVTTEDLSKLHTNHWPGVNGCYDTKEHWYDWTECISLDPHGDESRLNILPYVCFE